MHGADTGFRLVRHTSLSGRIVVDAAGDQRPPAVFAQFSQEQELTGNY
jgi:hypothetical protein